MTTLFLLAISPSFPALFFFLIVAAVLIGLSINPKEEQEVQFTLDFNNDGNEEKIFNILTDSLPNRNLISEKIKFKTNQSELKCQVNEDDYYLPCPNDIDTFQIQFQKRITITNFIVAVQANTKMTVSIY